MRTALVLLIAVVTSLAGSAQTRRAGASSESRFRARREN